MTSRSEGQGRDEGTDVQREDGRGRTHVIGGGWGCHISWLNDGRAKPVGLEDGTVGQGPRRVYGHMSRRPRLGDRLTAAMQSGRTAEFVFTEVKYERDPEDMFFGTVEFVEYRPDNGRHSQ